MIRRIILSLKQMSSSPQQQLRLLLAILPLSPFGQLIYQHLRQPPRVDIDIDDHVILVLDMGDVFEVLAVEFD